MKKLITIALCILTINTYSQNWQIINPNYSYNYKLGSSEIITHVIKVDSTINLESTTEYHLNKVIKRIEETSQGLLNQPQFLMHKMVKHNENHFVFEGPDTLLIKPKSKLNETWEYNANGITATVTEIYVYNIFNAQDSVKEITLSNNQQILLSKNFGIFIFPKSINESYNLVGIDGDNNFGEHYPDESDFMDYQPGDIIQIMDTYPYEEPPFYQAEISKFTINSIISENDTSITYDVTGRTVSEETGVSSYTNKTTFIAKKRFASNYPNEAIQIDNFLNPEYVKCMFGSTHLKYENERYIKSADPLWWQGYNNDTITINYSQHLGIHPHGLDIMYIEELGIYRNRWTAYGAWTYRVSGKVRNGDTIGDIYPNSYFNLGSSIYTHESDKPIAIYPNPSNKQITISIPGINSFSVRIINLNGQIQSEAIIENNNSIDVSEYPAGVYNIQIINDQNVLGNKRIIIY